ncbi:hypothetical protein D3C75_1084930 [compost metagenome]
MAAYASTCVKPMMSGARRVTMTTRNSKSYTTPGFAKCWHAALNTMRKIRASCSSEARLYRRPCASHCQNMASR